MQFFPAFEDRFDNIMKNLLNNLSDRACSAAKFICLICMLVLTPLVFANIISRFIFGYSIGWSSEVARYAFIWLTFMGMAVALRDDSHAKIDLLINSVPWKLKKWIMILANLIILILSIFLIYAGTKQVLAVREVQAAYMRFLSMSWMYMSIPVSSLFMFLFTLSGLANNLAYRNVASGESE
jgi:C4-dicarboxylate transporter DctQ subunit